MPIYDADTLLFMKESAEGPMGKPPVSTFGASGALPETLSETEPTRYAYPRPTQPQSPDNTQGSSLGSYPDGGIAKRTIKTLSSLQGGGSPAAVISKAVAKMGLQALAKTGQVLSIGPLSIYEKLNDLYHKSWFDWEPETVRQTLVHDWPEALSDETVSAIQALQVLVTTNSAQEHWHIFEKVGHALNLGHVDFSTSQPLDIHECALALKIINKVRPKSDFDPEIWHYIAACAKTAGYVYLPEEFFPKEAQDALDKMGNDLSLKNAVESSWKSKVKGKTDAENIQLDKLNAVKEYVS